ncbi:Zinc finger PHD-type [Penicillium chermesinum]|uniref:Zinc finger PHD-type n=1 Tax=Penicillium chermesinum TaxID=63820 RepID=A0A9W9TRH9_9EURO|nr:Zinc finger PHD-type [Penicillium chermesinum]KAJ5238731.1 Zinc finger PHD-type [Penicillium chermesinum]
MAPMPRQSISGRPSRSHHKSSMKAPRHVSLRIRSADTCLVGREEEEGLLNSTRQLWRPPQLKKIPPKKKNGTPRRHSNNARSRPAREIEQSLYAPPPPPPIPTTPPSMTRPRRDKSQNRGRFTSSTAAALALQQGDGYKPREERGWEEFHPDLDIDGKLAVFTADEVDAADAPPNSANPDSVSGALESLGSPIQTSTDVTPLPFKRRPGRPPRRPEALLNAIRFQPGPKVIPPPGPNPREKLTLPKPAFRLQDPFTFYEQKGGGQQNYVDRTMASVGYQESDVFLRHDRRFIRMTEGAQEDDMDVIQPAAVDNDINSTVGRVEYDMDEQDEKWLDDINAKRRDDQLEPIKPAIFEITMTKIEKEWHALEKRIPKPNPKPPQTQRPRSSSAAAVNGETVGPGRNKTVNVQFVTMNSNAIVFCDGCDLAVHQECYGVPFIPEGQWLCRKCQLLGRGTTNCIFCPNTEGAFKQTTSSKWAHLLCSFWIPEVSIGNPSLMEPVTDVEKVPRGRWKLLCYICKQKMGASIQCSNKNCFVAFHVSCARRAQLYLKMKIGHGLMDSHLLKAFCDKHVPPDWRLEHGTDAATADAIEYYRNTMQGRRWGDSQAAALSLAPSHAEEGEEECLHTPRITLTVGGNKRKRAARTIWKLPSGAPVIPQVVLNSVVASLGRFTVRGRKQYAEEACKYWTLKREARRGAALLKRLQLQLETFSSMEMTRRDYVAMGVTGHKRLQRRIEFGEHLYKDLDRLRMLCDEVKKREREKLKDAEMLRSIVDLVYFPIFPLLWPVFEKAQSRWESGIRCWFNRLQERFYPSVASFSADLASLFTSEIGVGPAGDTAQLQEQISGRAPELSVEQREKRKLAKRIIKSIQPALEDAIRKESELNRKPYEKELKELDVILDHSVMSRRGDSAEVEGDTELGIDPEDHKVEAMEGVEAIDNHDQMSTAPPADEVVPSRELATEDVVAQASVFEDETKPNINVITKRHPTPVLSEEDQQLPLAQGGIQWYMEPFDPVGTTIHEERWTGRDVMRGMSEELSELDEDELKDLVDDELPDTVNTSADNPGRSKQNVRRTRRSRW